MVGRGKPVIAKNPFLQKKVAGIKRVSDSHSNLLKQSHAMAIVARHAERTTSEKLLNKQGISQAIGAGRKLPPNMEIIAKASPVTRAVETVVRAKDAYKNTESRLNLERLTKEYMFDVLGEIDGYDQPIDDLKEIGKEYFRSQFTQILKRIESLKLKDNKPLYLNVSHESIEFALFCALGIVKTKSDLEKLFPKKRATKMDSDKELNLGYTEGVLFYFLNDGRVILSFRKQRFDITKNVENILNDQNARAERRAFYLKMADKYPTSRKVYNRIAGQFN